MEESTRRARGRPPGSRFGIKRNVYLDQESWQDLDSLTNEMSLSQSSVIRLALKRLRREEQSAVQ